MARPAGTLPKQFFDGATPAAKETFRALLRSAGIRMRSEQGRVAFRSDPTPPAMVRVKALLRKDTGKLRADATKTLRDGDLLLDEAARSASEQLRERYQALIPGSTGNAKLIPPTSFDALQLELFWNLDEVSVLRRWLTEWNGKVELYRLITTRALHMRDMFWRVVESHIRDGLTLQEMISGGRWPQINQISGTVVSQAAIWAVAPMAARVQPFAAAFSTIRGAEIVAIPRGAWNRGAYQSLGWPAGFGGLRLGGSGEDAYRRPGDDNIPHSVARDLLFQQVDGVNSLVHQLGDPGMWTSGPSRTLDAEERNIAWSTVNLGLTAIKDIAQDWGSDTSIWHAFRALGILAGFWTPPGQRDVPIAELVTPSVITDFAVPALAPPWIRDWYRDATHNWEAVLAAMFPGAQMTEAAANVQELRNLVHGTGAQPTRKRPRNARIRALMATGDENLQLIRDVATCWWLAVLQAPASHGHPGRPPF